VIEVGQFPSEFKVPGFVIVPPGRGKPKKDKALCGGKVKKECKEAFFS